MIRKNYTYVIGIFFEALTALRDNRLRSILSIFGMAVGVAAIIAVSAISSGGHYLVFNELKTFGLESLWVFRQKNDKDPNKALRKGSGIDETDYQLIRQGCCDKVKHVTPLVYSQGRRVIVRRGDSYSNAEIRGVGVDYFQINNDQLVDGRYFTLSDELRNRGIAIIGPIARNDLFPPYATVVGEHIRIQGKKVMVIGVLREKSRDFLASIGSTGGRDVNNRILVPYTYLQMLKGKDQAKAIDGLQGEAVSLEAAEEAVGQIESLLQRNHSGRFNYRHETMAQYIETANRILGGVSIIGLVAAFVSLLVGGMGVMNIMSTSVLERTREIGLRRSIGARKSDILSQFLMEAMMIGLIGGGIGLVVGIGASFVLSWLTNFPLQPTWLMVTVALCVSISVGLLSGLAPAIRAANLRPVVALRYE
ncbi:MAG: ABC transporter permease [Candidatus Thiodiazotropha sp.]